LLFEVILYFLVVYVSGSVFVFPKLEACLSKRVASRGVDKNEVLPFIKHNDLEDGDFFVGGKTVLLQNIDDAFRLLFPN